MLMGGLPLVNALCQQWESCPYGWDPFLLGNSFAVISSQDLLELILSEGKEITDKAALREAGARVNARFV